MCIRDSFHIADGAARRQALKLAFKLQLGERIDLLGHMHMVAVGDIVASFLLYTWLT